MKPSFIVTCSILSFTLYSADNSVLKQITSPDDAAAINHYITSLEPAFAPIGIDNVLESDEKQQLIHHILSSIETEQEVEELEQSGDISPDLQDRLKYLHQKVEETKLNTTRTIKNSFLRVDATKGLSSAKMDLNRKNMVEIEIPKWACSLQ